MKGTCRNCGFEIKDTETAATGPNGVAHHHYKRCLSAMTDFIDLMIDEFRRIKSTYNCPAEIIGLCERAITNTYQHVPVIVQRDNAEAKIASLESRLRESEAREAVLIEALSWIDESFNGRHSSPFSHMLEMAHKANGALYSLPDRAAKVQAVLEILPRWKSKVDEDCGCGSKEEQELLEAARGLDTP